MFIVFEGLDGAGKSTQTGKVAHTLRNLGHYVTVVHEPGSTLVGEEIRQILRKYDDLNVRTQALLFNAARAELIETVIAPALARGEVVLCDRYYWSTLAYQEMADMEKYGSVLGAITYAVGYHNPVDMTFLFDADPAILLARKNDDRNWMEDKELSFHQYVRQRYLRLASDALPLSMVLDATLPVETLTAQIVDEIVKLLALDEKDFA